MKWAFNLWSVFSAAGWKGFVLLGFVLVHTTWIVIHLSAVGQGKFNPWKLGGYGMYTIPPPKDEVSIFDLSFGRKQVDRKLFHRSGFRKVSKAFSFRCERISHDALQVFFDENPNFVDKDLEFSIHGRLFKKEPLSWERQEHTNIKLFWKKDLNYVVEGNVCGDVYRETGLYKPQ